MLNDYIIKSAGGRGVRRSRVLYSRGVRLILRASPRIELGNQVTGFQMERPRLESRRHPEKSSKLDVDSTRCEEDEPTAAVVVGV